MIPDLQIECDPNLGDKIIVTSVETAEQIRLMLGGTDCLILTTADEDDQVVRMGPKLFHEFERYMEEMMNFIEEC